MNDFLVTVMLTIITVVVFAGGISALIFLYALTEEFFRETFMRRK